MKEAEDMKQDTPLITNLKQEELIEKEEQSSTC